MLNYNKTPLAIVSELCQRIVDINAAHIRMKDQNKRTAVRAALEYYDLPDRLRGIGSKMWRQADPMFCRSRKEVFRKSKRKFDKALIHAFGAVAVTDEAKSYCWEVVQLLDRDLKELITTLLKLLDCQAIVKASKGLEKDQLVGKLAMKLYRSTFDLFVEKTAREIFWEDVELAAVQNLDCSCDDGNDNDDDDNDDDDSDEVVRLPAPGLSQH
jgi:hypothetical protein